MLLLFMADASCFDGCGTFSEVNMKIVRGEMSVICKPMCLTCFRYVSIYCNFYFPFALLIHAVTLPIFNGYVASNFLEVVVKQELKIMRKIFTTDFLFVDFCLHSHWSFERFLRFILD